MDNIFEELESLLAINPPKALELAVYISKRKTQLQEKYKEFLASVDYENYFIINDVVKKLYNLDEISLKQAVRLDYYANLNTYDKQIMEMLMFEEYRTDLTNYQKKCTEINNYLIYMNTSRICAKSCNDMSNAVKYSFDLDTDNPLELVYMLPRIAGETLGLKSQASIYCDIWNSLQEECESVTGESLVDRYKTLKKLSKRIMQNAETIKFCSVIDGKDDNLIIYETAHFLRTAMSKDAFKMLRKNEKEKVKVKDKIANDFELVF